MGMQGNGALPFKEFLVNIQTPSSIKLAFSRETLMRLDENQSSHVAAAGNSGTGFTVKAFACSLHCERD